MTTREEDAPSLQTTPEKIAAAEPVEPARPVVGILDWVLYPCFLIPFLGSLLVFEVVQRIALVFGVRAHERVISALNHALMFSLWCVGTRIKREGTPPIADDTPCIIISNHQSLFDISLLALSFPQGRPRYVAKKELGRGIPSVSINLARGGSALIDRKDPRQAIPELKKLGARMIAQRFSAVIFPEGTRARFGTLKSFHHAGISALMHGAPDAVIVPVVLDGTWQLSAYGIAPIPRGQTVRLRYLPPLDRTGKNAKEITQEAHQRIAEALLHLRSCATDGI